MTFRVHVDSSLSRLDVQLVERLLIIECFNKCLATDLRVECLTVCKLWRLAGLVPGKRERGFVREVPNVHPEFVELYRYVHKNSYVSGSTMAYLISSKFEQLTFAGIESGELWTFKLNLRSPCFAIGHNIQRGRVNPRLDEKRCQRMLRRHELLRDTGGDGLPPRSHAGPAQSSL
jgi:hypothetical protein